jgi:HEAT repeats
MAFRLAGNSPGDNLYNLLQSVEETRRTCEEHLKAAMEGKLGHSVDNLKNQPQLLRELLSDHDKEKRMFAVRFLDKFDHNLPDYEQIFERLAVQDPAPCVRSTAILALGELGTYRHRDEIVRLLHGILADANEVASVRKSAYLAMRRIYQPTSADLDVEGPFELLEGFLDGTGDDAAFIDEHINADWIRKLTE